MSQSVQTPSGHRSTATDKESSTATVSQIRAQFPALQRKQNGHPVAYFDGPGGTQVPKAVGDAVADYLYHHNANTHWNYPASAETDAIIEESRTTVAEFVNGAPEEIVFGANATSLTFHVSRTLGRLFSAGDEIAITELDHHANVGPWQALAQERGCTLRVVRMDTKTGELDWSDFEQKVTQRTKLIAVGAASNALGTINDIPRAARLARAVGALLFVDAVHYVPHHLADVRAMDCDFLAMSAYKFYGPHIGALWCRRDLLEKLPFPKLVPAPDRAPDRAETGTLNHEGIAGTTAAIDFLANLAQGKSRREKLDTAMRAIHERCIAFTQQMWSPLAAIDGVTLFGPPADSPRTSTVAFTVRGAPSADVARLLAERGVFVSHGNFYAHTVVERLGLEREGLVRAGCACYTTAEEVDRLIAGVREIARQ
jgi:cysteine desulfurase family protein (TIGR01976 family)